MEADRSHATTRPQGPRVGRSPPDAQDIPSAENGAHGRPVGQRDINAGVGLELLGEAYR